MAINADRSQRSYCVKNTKPSFNTCETNCTFLEKLGGNFKILFNKQNIYSAIKQTL